MSQNLLYPNGDTKAEFLKVLEPGECPCKYDANTYIIKNNTVYKIV